MRAIVLGWSCLVLCACSVPVDELRQEPVRFSVTAPRVPFDAMANCISAESADHWPTTMQINLQARSANVTAPNMADFQIRSVGAGSVVDWRRRKLAADMGGLEATSRQIVDHCAKG